MNTIFDEKTTYLQNIYENVLLLKRDDLRSGTVCFSMFQGVFSIFCLVCKFQNFIVFSKNGKSTQICPNFGYDARTLKSEHKITHTHHHLCATPSPRSMLGYSMIKITPGNHHFCRCSRTFSTLNGERGMNIRRYKSPKFWGSVRKSEFLTEPQKLYIIIMTSSYLCT